MEEKSEENKKKLTINNIIESLKKAIKLIQVSFNGNEIELPIYYNANASNAYHDAFEETGDYRKAFCMMVIKIVGDMKHLKFGENKFPILSEEDIENLSDNDLQKIAEEIVSQSKMLRDFYKDDSKVSLKNFNSAMICEKNIISENIVGGLNPAIEMAKRINKSYGTRLSEFQKINSQISPALSSLMRTLDNVNSNRNMDKILGLAASYRPQANIQNNIFESEIPLFKKVRPLFNPVVRTNELLLEVSQGLEELNKLQGEQFKSNIKISEEIANTLIEEQYARIQGEKEAKEYQLKTEKRDKNNFRISVTVLIVSTMAMVASVFSFLGYDRVFRTFKILLNQVFK